MQPVRTLLGKGISASQIRLHDVFAVPRLLKQQGFGVIDEGDLDKTLLSTEVCPDFADTRAQRDFLRQLNGKELRSALRKWLRGDGGRPGPLPADLEIAPGEASRERLDRTVEALIAYLLMTDLGAYSASFGVRIEGAPDGADFDCVANAMHWMLHVEVKSGNAANVKKRKLQSFLDRHLFLRPTASILFLDGNDACETVVRRFEGLRRTPAGQESPELDIVHATRLERQNRTLYSISPSVLVVDLHRNGNILANLSEVLRYVRAYQDFARELSYNALNPHFLGYTAEQLFGLPYWAEPRPSIFDLARRYEASKRRGR